MPCSHCCAHSVLPSKQVPCTHPSHTRHPPGTHLAPAGSHLSHTCVEVAVLRPAVLHALVALVVARLRAVLTKQKVCTTARRQGGATRLLIGVLGRQSRRHTYRPLQASSANQAAGQLAKQGHQHKATQATHARIPPAAGCLANRGAGSRNHTTSASDTTQLKPQSTTESRKKTCKNGGGRCLGRIGVELPPHQWPGYASLL